MTEPAQQQPRPDKAQNQPVTGNILDNGAKVLLIDEMIEKGTPFTYKGESLKDDRVVAKFVDDHRPITSAMFGSMVFLYTDPCTCCIPAYGPRNMQYKIKDPSVVIEYITEAVQSNKTPDLIFLNETLYRDLKEEIAKISPLTKLIVACDRLANKSASELRKQGIPAISDVDYLDCAPLNAMIALVVFNEVVS